MEYIKEIGKKGKITYKCNNKYLYSTYDPETEAKKYLDTLDKINEIAITLCGTDYINSELIKRGIKLIISYEPRKFESFLNNENLIRAYNIEQLENILLTKNIHASQLSLIIWQPLIESDKEFYLKEIKNIKDIIHKASISSNTAKITGFIETKNILINLQKLKSIRYLKKNNQEKKLALLVSSGASLQNYLNYIQRIKDKVTIFALPSAAPFLYDKEILPDFVIAVDPGYATFYHLAKIKNKISLILPLSITQSILNLKNCDFIFFNYHNPIEQFIYRDTEIVTSPSEGSVFINSLRILSQIGFSHTIILGQDFSFYNNRLHIKEGSFERDFFKDTNFFNSLEKKIFFFENSHEKVTIKINDKIFQSTLQLKLYYEHFIKTNFDVKLLIPDNAYNPISNNIKKITEDYIIKNFTKCDNKIETANVKNINSIKSEIFKIIKESFYSGKNEDIQLISSLFIDKSNNKHITKLTKILKG